ncbi:MAG: MotA/TolQ/ExbB proton channel family protein [Desulfobacteraceae bacterium]|jgi:biopolymer transport protein ExbB
MYINNKKIIGTLSVLAFLIFSGQVFATSEGWKKVAENINKDQDQSLVDVAEMEKYLKMDEAALKKELAKLRDEDKKEGNILDSLEKKYEALRKEEAQHEKALADERSEIQAIEDNVRNIVKDAISVSRDNPITAEYPDRKEILQNIADSKRFPGMDWIRILVEFYFSEMEETGVIKKRTGEFVGPDGRATTGEIIRLGRLMSYFRLNDGTVGFLKPEADGRRLVAVTGDAPGSMLSAIGKYFDNESNILPIDLSGGSAFIQMTKKLSPSEWMDQGGPIMYAIAAVGLFALILGIERFIVLGTKARASEKVMNYIKDMVSQSNFSEAKAFCSSKSRIPTCQMLDSALEHVGHSQEVIDSALQEAILKQVPKLEKFIPTLALFAAISPLMGLLGTVSGMIETFKIIVEVGTGDPAQLADGISVALLTTYFGLCVAIPIMFVHHFLKSQVDRIVVDMQEKGTAFAITLLKQQSGKAE